MEENFKKIMEELMDHLKIKYLSYILAVLMLFSCSEKKYDYIKEVDKLTADYCQEFQKNYHLRLSGYGGGMMGSIYKIGFYFDSEQLLDIDSTREIAIEFCEGLLERLNADEELRPYYKVYPYNNRGLELCLSFYDHFGNYVPKPYIANAFISHPDNGPTSLVYYVKNNGEEDLTEVHEETYEKALEIVRERTSKVNPTD
jgi:hypothetical protein